MKAMTSRAPRNGEHAGAKAACVSRDETGDPGEDGAAEAGCEEDPAGIGGVACASEEHCKDKGIGGRQRSAEKKHGDVADRHGRREYE